MTRHLFWLIPLFGLALLGCPNSTNSDDSADADADTDADSDTDTDADSDADSDSDSDTDVYATVVAKTGVVADFSFSQYFDPTVCEDATECRMPVDAPDTYPVYAEADDYLFGNKEVLVDKTGDTEAVWGEGQWGADFSGDWVEANDSEYPGVEHEVEVTTNGEFVKIEINRADGCLDDTLMTGLEFAYDGGDGYTCAGYGTADLGELFVDASTPSDGSYHIHLVRAN